MSLETLVAPCSVRTFMSEYFEQGYLHIKRNDPAYFGALLADLHLPQLIWRSGADGWGKVSLARAATAPAANPYAAERPGIDNIEAAFADRYTVVLNNVQEQSVAVAAFCRAVEQHFLFRCNANIYLTAPFCQGLEAHYDDQDVFILQLEGSKTWRVFEGGPVLPMEEQAYACPDIAGLRFADLQLRPGDVLYLPHGTIHDARTEEEQSLHLTISVSAIRQATLLKHALQLLAERDGTLRRSVPLWALRDDSGARHAALLQALRESLSRLDGADLQQAVSGCQDRLLQAVSRLPAASLRTQAPAALDARATLALAADQICLVASGPDGSVLKFIGGQLPLSDDLVPAARFVCSGRQFTPGEMAGELSDTEKSQFAAFLIMVGVLERQT